jgi:hypothetical protein
MRLETDGFYSDPSHSLAWAPLLQYPYGMGFATSTAIAVQEPPAAAARRSAHDVEAAIAAWLSVAGDRHSKLRQVLRGGSEPQTVQDFLALDYEEVEIDDALLRRLLVGISCIPA